MKLILSVIFIFLSAVTIAQELPATHYKIYSTSAQKTITPDDIVNDMANADVLFFGEEHNDSTAHYLEFSLLKKLSEKYPQKTALSMEMFKLTVSWC